MARKSAFDLVWKEHSRGSSQWSDKRNSKAGPAYPHLKHKAAKESLWIDGFYNPSWMLRRRAQDGDPIQQDEAPAFVALLRACAKHKDLCRGSRVHDDILRRGLLQKCSDALVTMYAKCG
eukprot:c24989_g1_i1 orf=42-401(+)